MDMFYSFTPVLSPKYLTLNLLATLMVIYQSSGWVQGQISGYPVLCTSKSY